MGCDIHMAVEVRGEDGQWRGQMWPNKWYGKFDYYDEKPESLRAFDDRSYDTFAILGNVRNGSGFAGCDTGDGFKFIGADRGIPEDSDSAVREYVNETGDHSHSYVTLAEVLAFDWTQRTKKRGWVSAKTFEKWDRCKEWDVWPDDWSGGISGGRIQHVLVEEMRRNVQKMIGDARGQEYSKRLKEYLRRYEHHYCLIEWEVSYADAAKGFWVGWVPKLLRLGKPEDVRCVFSFDS